MHVGFLKNSNVKKWRTAERSDMLFQSMGRGEVEEEGVLAVGTAAGWGSGSLCTGTDMSYQ